MSMVTQDDLNAAMDQIRRSALDREAIAESQGRLQEIMRRNEELLNQYVQITAAQRAMGSLEELHRSLGAFARLRKWLTGQHR